MELKELHEKILYPIVRVRAPGEGGKMVGGTGTVIYSKLSKDSKDEYQTFILTNHHVIAGAVVVKKEWDSVAEHKVDKAFLTQVDVEVFDYVYMSTVNSSNSYKADIVAYDEPHDLAVLKLSSPTKNLFVSTLIPKNKIKDLRLFMPIRGCGCSLAHDPFSTSGEITSIKEVIDNKEYFMTSQNSIFGNSGGAIFLADTGEQIGVTSRVTGIQLGFGVDMMTWMGFSAAPQRIYEFVDEQELKFLYDSKDTYEAAMKRRESKRRAAMERSSRKSEEEGEDGEGR